jgi:molybdopterin synthase catalytic subunit
VSVRLTSGRLSIARAYATLADPKSGGVVLFVGRVRPDRRRGGEVSSLFYEAHTTVAESAMTALEAAARRRPGVRQVLLWHRTGDVPVGEPSVIVGVGAAHRAEAFEACRSLIDELKSTVPIWKTDRARPARRRPRSPRPRARGSTD